ncbi:MAG: TonB family protein [Desulforegulaceae bacterium]|nr:TonB family protein [Desulforegulaceae bacterium]
MDRENNRPNEPGLFVFVIFSIVFHCLIFSMGLINLKFGKSDFDYQKNSLNVSVVYSSEAEFDKKEVAPVKASGKNLDIEPAKVDKIPEIEDIEPAKVDKIPEIEDIEPVKADKIPEIEDKKPVFSGAKKKLPKKEVKEVIASQKKNLEKNKDLAKNKLTKEIAQLKKEIEKSDTDSTDKVLEDIKSFKKAISSQNQGKDQKSDSMFSDLEKGAEKSEKIDIYRYRIAYEVERQWALPNDFFNADGVLETSIVFTVLPDGKIQNIWFDRKSGNEYLDNSVYRAVKKAEPLPPHPEGLEEKSVMVGLRFTPEGLR